MYLNISNKSFYNNNHFLFIKLIYLMEIAYIFSLIYYKLKNPENGLVFPINN